MKELKYFHRTTYCIMTPGATCVRPPTEEDSKCGRPKVPPMYWSDLLWKCAFLQSNGIRSATSGCRRPKPRGAAIPRRPLRTRVPSQLTALRSAQSPRPSAWFSPVRTWDGGGSRTTLFGEGEAHYSANLFPFILLLGNIPHLASLHLLSELPSSLSLGINPL